MELVQAWKEQHRDCRLMHRKFDLIGSKLVLKFYTPPSPVGGGGETTNAIGKKMDAKLGLKEKLGADQRMHIDGYDEGEKEHMKGS